jgi:hypothetical protein
MTSSLLTVMWALNPMILSSSRCRNPVMTDSTTMSTMTPMATPMNESTVMMETKVRRGRK